MATSKLIKPTNVTVSIPEFTDQPDQRVNSNCIDKTIDGVNSLNDQKANCSDIAYIEETSTASRNYLAGDFIYVEGVLRRASYAITSGTTISGSNSSKITNGAINQKSKVNHTTYTMETSSSDLRLDNKGLGVTLENFIRAIVSNTNNIVALPYTYSGYLYLNFYNRATMATISGTYALDILYYS